MKRAVGVLLVCLLIVSLVSAQAPLRVPRVSPGAKITQAVGLSDITVAYSRPGVKGREVWGNVVKYDEVWRAGANEPTLFTFSDEVTIAGKKLGAGMYRFVVVPARTGDWTLIFNSEVKNWGTVYEAKYDTLKFAVKPESGPHEEWMSFSFADLTPSSARVVLAWEKIRLSFVVEFNTLAKLQASVGTWQVLNQAARFALDNKVYPQEAMGWVDRSIALEKNPRNLQTKAELLAQAGKAAEAVSLAEEAVKMAQAKDPKANVDGLQKLIQGWKGK
jgi:hypothetical protein